MKFGPYTMSAVNSAADALEKAGIPFEVEDDKELLAAQEKAYREKALSRSQRGAQFDPAFLFLKFEEAYLERAKALLPVDGEAEALPHDAPDFSVEEYVCPDCGKVVSEQPGTCAVHGVALVTWTAHVEAKRAAGAGTRSGKGMPKWLGYAMLFLFALAIAARFGHKLALVFR